MELDRRPFEVQLQAVIAQRAVDIAKLENAKRDLARYELLATSDSVTPQTLDASRALVTQMQATVNADQAQIDAARLQLDYATIRSPIDGRLGARLVDAGNVVHAGDANGLVVVSQIQPVFVSFSLPQDVLTMLRQQQDSKPLQVVALIQDASKELDTGELTLIDNLIDATTGTVRCKAMFQNSHELLWPGAFVAVRVVLHKLSNVVTVPTSAIQTGAQHAFVYVITPEHVAVSRPVEPGPASGSQTVVAGGLSGGEQVVVEGQFQLEDGSPVEITDKPSPDPAAASAGGSQ